MDNVLAKKGNFTRDADQLKAELNSVQTNLSDIVKKCDKNGSLTAQCDILRNIQLNGTIDLTTIPNIDKYKNEMQKVKNLKLEDNIKKVLAYFFSLSGSSKTIWIFMFVY